MRTLVPIKIKVGLDQSNGYAKYPNFNLISSSIRKGLDWSKYVDVHGIGMHYDKTSGHKEESADSPFGQQLVCTCVPADFTNEVIALFPNEVSLMTEAEFQTFYDNKAHAHEPNELVDVEILQAIKAKEDLGLATPEKANAVNPNHVARGIRKNDRRKWIDAKAKMGVNI